jgi:5-formyltetrahydrofolate cyclo-ligase
MRLSRNILASEAYQKAKTVLVFNAFGSEPDLSAFIEKAQAEGKLLCWPCCLAKTEMAAYTPRSESDWRTGAFGIREPNPNHSLRIHPEEIDLVLCPCAGFDRFGNRVGMGAGYYDRYLPQCINAAVMITAFEAQRAARIFTEETDVSIHWIATQAGVFPAETEQDTP